MNSSPYNDTTILKLIKVKTRKRVQSINISLLHAIKESSQPAFPNSLLKTDIRTMRNSIIISPNPLSQVEITEKICKIS